MRYTFISLIIAVLLIGCRPHSAAWNDMDSAESVMEEFPDSALLILEDIDSDKLSSNEGKARHALLMSMALDKNYVDTTTFNVLQPAIDYYLDKNKGNPDDKLRTHYYRGRIYQNQGDNSRAMTSFIRATETNGITDMLTLARTHVAMSVLYNDAYNHKEMTNHALKSADLFQKLNYTNMQMSCYLRALEGSILDDNRTLSDSLLSLCTALNQIDSTFQTDLDCYRLSYALNYGTTKEIEKQIKEISNNDIPQWIYCDIARGYLNLGMPDQAEQFLISIDSLNLLTKFPQYLINLTDAYETGGKYKEAYYSLKKLYELNGEKELLNSEYNISFIQEQHQKEINNTNDRQHKNYLILGSIALICILITFIGMLFYRHNLIQAKVIIIEKDKEQLKSEKIKIELERERDSLISDNQALQIEQMKTEIDTLKRLIDNNGKISKPIGNAVKERILMLNSLIASEISDNKKYATPYEEWKEKILQDYKEFMNTTRLAFKVSHPDLMSYFEKHELNDDEINYACLYAIGLNGKEIGKYIHSQRHYHLSSVIRKKLGLDINNTNLGIHIRKLMDKQ